MRTCALRLDNERCVLLTAGENTAFSPIDYLQERIRVNKGVTEGIGSLFQGCQSKQAKNN